MKPVDFTYHRAASVEDALERLAEGGDGAKLIVGGQSLGPMLNLRLTRPRELIDISSVEALLRESSRQRESVIAGAAVTHAEIEDRPASDPIEHAMREVATGIAYRGVRNRGTIGGSIVACRPGDGLDAAFCCARTHGYASAAPRASAACRCRTSYVRRTPPRSLRTKSSPTSRSRAATGRARFGFYKLCRKTGELAEAIGAVLVDPERRYGRVVAGAVGSKPVVAAGRDAITRRHRHPCPRFEALRVEIAAGTSEHDPVKLHMAAVAVARAIDRAMAAR